MRALRKVKPDLFRSADLKKNFGITLGDYNVILEAQGGVCAICLGKESVVDNRTQKPRNLAVDHDHDTDEVRGLLCMACNQGLGNFREDAQTLRSAIAYLESRKALEATA